MKRRVLLWAAALLAGACAEPVPADRPVAVVPVPQQVTVGKGVFEFSAATPVVVREADQGMEPVVEALSGLSRGLFGRELACRRSDEAAAGAVSFALCDSLPAESYTLRVTAQGVEVRAGAPAGAFYAVQTLRQLLPVAALDAAPVRSVELPAVDLRDAPALTYRGLMLDVARHFFTVEEVERTLDLMAMHKMNVFHWHLTDDQGWRLEIRKYLRLTQVGSVRRRTLLGKDPGGEYDETCRYDETPYGGFYTQEQIREVVDYAARRFITVIPEIEFPGHAVAALASYPWLSCTGEQYEVRQTWDIDERVFCIGREETFRFMEEVLDEVLELFPSTYIHIGGDECPTEMWTHCPRCQARMRALGLTRPQQLQGYATARIEDWLRSRGRRLIGWDEILDGGVTPTAAVMSWRGVEGGIRAARQGNRVVLAPTTHCYLDYYQTADTEGEPLAWGGCLPLEKVYALDPYEGLGAEEQQFLLGVQANLWTEYIPDFGQAQYMLLPRLAAIAEVGWSRAGKNYADFVRRTERLMRFYEAEGYKPSRHVD